MCVVWKFPIALKFDRQLGTTSSGPPIKFQNDWITLNRNLVRPRLNEILGYRPWWSWKTNGIEVIIRVLLSFLTTTYTDHPKLIRTTQPSTMGGPLGDPRFWTLDSTVIIFFIIIIDIVVVVTIIIFLTSSSSSSSSSTTTTTTSTIATSSSSIGCVALTAITGITMPCDFVKSLKCKKNRHR